MEAYRGRDFYGVGKPKNMHAQQQHSSTSQAMSSDFQAMSGEVRRGQVKWHLHSRFSSQACTSSRSRCDGHAPGHSQGSDFTCQPAVHQVAHLDLDQSAVAAAAVGPQQRTTWPRNSDSHRTQHKHLRHLPLAFVLPAVDLAQLQC